MTPENRIAFLLTGVGLGSNVVAMAVPVLIPSAPWWLWYGILSFGIVLTLLCALFVVSDFLLKKIRQRIQLATLAALICGCIYYGVFIHKPPPTLRDYYNKDYEWGPILVKQGFGVDYGGGETLDIDVTLTINTMYRSSFALIYAPAAKDPILLYKFLASHYRSYIDLATIGPTGEKLNGWYSIPGDSHQMTFDDVTFSGRVVLYHENIINEKQRREIEDAFAADGDFPILRSMEYLTYKRATEKSVAK